MADKVYEQQIGLQQSLDIHCQYNRNHPGNNNFPK
jgi:hypothetical protein